MMTAYLWVKLVHILSATLLFGTGLGTAFFMFRAWRSRNSDAMRVTARNVVIADWIFTTPAVVVQLVTGLWLVNHLNIAMDSLWFRLVIGLYVFVGACWAPVVWIQTRVRNLLAKGAERAEYEKLMRAWTALGVPAFASVLALFYLMLSKYGAYG